MLFCYSTLLLTSLPLCVFAFSIHSDQDPLLPTKASQFAPTQWQHPGYVVDKAQLDFVKGQVANNSQPWADAYNHMLKDKDAYGKYVSGTRTSETTATVSCGPTTKPDIKCTDERGDALAAWGNALAWYVSGDTAYAKNAIGLMNKWSYVIEGHALSNAILQTAWAGASWARAGELIRHTTSNLWSTKDITQFESMLRNVYLPPCKNGDTRASNWDVACLNTAIGIAVFLEDADVYNHAMDLFQQTVPSVIYLESDGALPHAARGLDSSAAALKLRWFNQQSWGNSGQSGQIQETCRDLTHTGYSISSISHVLETSRIQGLDQYTGDLGTRLRFALGFHAQFEQGVAPPSWLCQNKGLTRDLSSVTEIGFNALSTRLGNNMPKTQAYTERIRPQGTNGLFYGWETLTHAGNTA
ncbi:chondroitin AC/alginate lyase [Acephala macrosclerotiorum]|nr:chondroitin AC/alginate lyase [Acephala macrosclerotiorum]